MKPHPWFNPLYRRIAVFAFCVAWTAVEAWSASGWWVWMAAGVSVYALYDFFLAGHYPTSMET